MDINTAITQAAATDPQIYALVAKQGTVSSVLAALTGAGTSSTSTAGAADQEPSDAQLLQSVESNIGQNIDTQA